MSFIDLKAVASCTYKITPIMLQALGIGLYPQTSTGFIEVAPMVFEIKSLATAQKMCVGGGEAPLIIHCKLHAAQLTSARVNRIS